MRAGIFQDGPPGQGGKISTKPQHDILFRCHGKGEDCALSNTVSENREGFTRKEYKGPREAQRAMHLLGFPSEREFENMVRSNMIVN